MIMVLYIFKSMRPFQWYKNAIVFLAIIFGAKFLELDAWIISIVTFLVFCLVSGGIYILNDINDRKIDRIHPRKAKRPIASGELNVKIAFLSSILLIAAALCIAAIVNIYLLLVVLSFTIIHIFYNFILKKIFLVDIITIGIGFVLRGIAGAIALDVFISPWLIIEVFLLALVLALAKRTGEITSLQDNGSDHRTTLIKYDGKSTEIMFNICISTLYVSYIVYCSTQLVGMFFSVPFATYGIFRYLYLVNHHNMQESAESILYDRPIIISLVLWGIAVLAVMAFS